MIRLIAIDIDGTLVTPLKKITRKNKQAIERAKKSGIQIALASGRPISSMEKFIEELNLNTDSSFSIAQNGSYIHRNSDGKVLFSVNNEKRDLLPMLEGLRPYKLDLSFMDERNFYTMEKNPGFFTRMNALFTGRKLTFFPYDEIEDDKKFGRFLAMGPSKNIKSFYSNIPKNLSDNYYLVKTSPFQIEIMNKNTNKGQGLRHLAKLLNIDPQEIMAIGNEENDIPMINFAGLGVAMGNGSKLLQDNANFVTKSNLKSGVAFAINKFI